MKKLLYILFLLLPFQVMGQEYIDGFEIIEKQGSYYYVMQEADTVSQHSTIHKAIQRAFEVSKTAQGSQVWIQQDQRFNINYSYAQFSQDTVTVYDTTDVESLALRNVNMTYSKSLDVDYRELSYQAESHADSVRFRYFSDGLLLKDTLQYPRGGVVADTLKSPPIDTIAVYIDGYWDKWVEPYIETVNVAFLDTLGGTETLTNDTMANDKQLTITADATLSVNGNAISGFDFALIRSKLTTTEADEFWNNVKSDGGDIQVFYNGTRVAVDIRSFDSSTETGFMFFDSSGHTASTATEWTIEFGDTSLTQPATTDTYGRNNVYTGWLGVYGLEKDPSGTAPQVVDYTGNGYDGTTEGSMTSGDLVAGKVDKGIDFDGSDDAVDLGTSINTPISNANAATFLAWFKPDTLSSDASIVSARSLNNNTNFLFYIDVGGANIGPRLFLDDGPRTSSDVGNITTGSYYHVAATFDGSVSTVYENGSQIDTASGTGTLSPTTRMTIGTSDDSGRYADGIEDEVWVSDSAFSGDYIQELYNNQDNQSGFWSVSEVTDIGGGATTLTVGDVGSGVDSPAISVSASESDTGQGIDNTSIGVDLAETDVGGGAGNISIQAGITVSDAGSAIEVISGQILTAVQDAATGVDNASADVGLSVSDAGQGIGSVSIFADVFITDTGSGTDAITVLKEVLKNVSDIGAGSDDISISADVGITDVGSGVDSPLIQASIPVGDTGAGADAVSVLKEILKTVIDTGTGSGNIGIAADMTVNDAAVGSDEVTIDVSLSVADAGQGIDAITTIQEKLVQIADAGQGTDDVSINVQVQLSEQGHAAEEMAILNTLSVIDQGQGVDSALAFDAEVYVADIVFSFTQRRFDYEFSQRTLKYNFSQRSFSYAFEGQN